MHSPFVFEFIEKVLEDNRWFYPFTEIENLRVELYGNRTKIQLTDFGAGSKFHPSGNRSIRSLARHSANKQYACQLLFKIVDSYKPRHILELGTSLGISTLYLSAAAMDAELITIEGDPELAKLARANFKSFGRTNVNLVNGSFAEFLPKVLQEIPQLDLAFIDGNHKKEPTLFYFEQCMGKVHPESILIFDDIHWSGEMNEAWEAIKSDPRVTLSLDLFFMGIVFFRKEFTVKEDYTLIKWAWKPWAIGLSDYLS